MLIKHILKFQIRFKIAGAMLQNQFVHFSILQTSVLIRLITFLYPYVTAICKILNWERSAYYMAWQHQGQSKIYHFNSHLITKTRFDNYYALMTVKCKLRAFSYSKKSSKSFVNQTSIVKSGCGHHEKITNSYARSFSA